MGDAKRKRHAMITSMLTVAESWAFPADLHEATICADVAKLEVIEVPRASEAEMEYMKMVPRECHTNCMVYVKLDPEGLSEHVIGWIPWPEAYVLHSVIRRGGKLLCITPMLSHARSSKFIVDERLNIIEEPGGRGYRIGRDAVPLEGAGVRKDPPATIAHMTAIKNRLLSGEDPNRIMADLGFYT